MNRFGFDVDLLFDDDFGIGQTTKDRALQLFKKNCDQIKCTMTTCTK